MDSCHRHDSISWMHGISESSRSVILALISAAYKTRCFGGDVSLHLDAVMTVSVKSMVDFCTGESTMRWNSVDGMNRLTG